jgi:hypothetical protein
MEQRRVAEPQAASLLAVAAIADMLPAARAYLDEEAAEQPPWIAGFVAKREAAAALKGMGWAVAQILGAATERCANCSVDQLSQVVLPPIVEALENTLAEREETLFEANTVRRKAMQAGASTEGAKTQSRSKHFARIEQDLRKQLRELEQADARHADAVEQLAIGFTLSGHPVHKFNGQYQWIYTQDGWPVLAKGFVVDAEMATQGCFRLNRLARRGETVEVAKAGGANAIMLAMRAHLGEIGVRGGATRVRVHAGDGGPEGLGGCQSQRRGCDFAESAGDFHGQEVRDVLCVRGAGAGNPRLSLRPVLTQSSPSPHPILTYSCRSSGDRRQMRRSARSRSRSPSPSRR